MRRCNDCKIILDDDVRHCPKCGKDLSTSQTAARQASGDIDSLLASSNLHRIRAEWDEAIADATEALRAEPRNPDIASLLGSIYEERGMPEEALVWFQMALELNPDSKPDQERLSRVTKRTETSRAREETHSFRLFEKRTRLWAVALGSVFALIVIVAIYTSLTRRHPDHAAQYRRSHVPQSQQFEPRENAPESSMPQGPGRSAEKQGAAPSAQAGGAARTAGESYIRSELAGAQSITETGANIDDVIADPRSGVVSVTFTMPFKGYVTKDQIIRPSVAIARKTLDLNREVKFVTIRCVIQTGGAQGSQIAFVGDIARQTVDALSPAATTDQLISAFTHPWWNPQIK